MPKQTKTQRHTTPSRKTIVQIVLISIIILVVVFVGGKMVLDSRIEQQKIDQQRSTLTQTLADITKLYDKFIASDNQRLMITRAPENRCSETSSKSVDKLYTCGTRASISYPGAEESSFISTSNVLSEAVTEPFTIVDIDDIHEDELYNALNMQLTLTHNDTGQICYVFGKFYRDQTSFTGGPNEIRYSFHCNLNTSQPIFELEDYDK